MGMETDHKSRASVRGSVTDNKLDEMPGQAGEYVGGNEPVLSMDSKSKRLSSFERLLPEDFTYSWKLTVLGHVKTRRFRCCGHRPSLSTTQVPILRSVCGAFKSGELWAIMGASGAGKTTLLNSLNFRNKKSPHVEGDRCINGVAINPQIISAASAYLQQDDLLPTVLTIREHLMFTALLKLPALVPSKLRNQRVDQVLHDVGLWAARNNYIGGFLRKGISGGERKRLAFASEIITDPSILFCDEPTSGLDSFMAKIVVEIMQKMAARGKLVVCTIHQPSTEVFACFDHLYLLTEGMAAFAGSRVDALKFFADQGYQCPATHNPADFYIRTLAIIPGRAEECRQRALKIVLEFTQSQHCKQIQQIHQDAVQSAGKNEHGSEDWLKAANKKKKYATNVFFQFGVLLWRMVTLRIRSPEELLTYVFAHMFLGFVIGLSAYKVKMDMFGIGTMCGILVMSMFSLNLTPLYVAIIKLPNDVPLILREHWNGLYTLFSYYMANAFVEAIIFSVFPLVFFPFVFFMVGLAGPTETTLPLHLLTLVSTANVGGAVGSTMGHFSSSVVMAVTNSILLVSPFLIYCGYFTDDKNMPTPTNYIHYLSMDYYALENMMSVQWKHFGNVTDLQARVIIAKDGNDILRFYKYGDNYWRNIGLLYVILLFFRVCGYLILLLRGLR